MRPDLHEALVFYVGSRSNPGKEHKVDLEAYNGCGWCACGDFEHHLEKHLKEHGAKPSRHLQCWHIRQAMMELGHTLQVRIINERRRVARENKARSRESDDAFPPQQSQKRNYVLHR